MPKWQSWDSHQTVWMQDLCRKEKECNRSSVHAYACVHTCVHRKAHTQALVCDGVCTLSVSMWVCMCVSVCAYLCFCTGRGKWQKCNLQRVRPCFEDLDIYPEGTREPCKNLDKGVDMIRFLFRKITLSGVCGQDTSGREGFPPPWYEDACPPFHPAQYLRAD